MHLGPVLLDRDEHGQPVTGEAAPVEVLLHDERRAQQPDGAQPSARRTADAVASAMCSSGMSTAACTWSANLVHRVGAHNQQLGAGGLETLGRVGEHLRHGHAPEPPRAGAFRSVRPARWAVTTSVIASRNRCAAARSASSTDPMRASIPRHAEILFSTN